MPCDDLLEAAWQLWMEMAQKRRIAGPPSVTFAMAPDPEKCHTFSLFFPSLQKRTRH
jgi:hypothetical protein